MGILADYSDHANAPAVAEAAQEKFWKMHDNLYKTQSQWSEVSD